MPFGPQAHCEVDKRAVNQGTKYKREVGQGEEGGKLMKNGEQYHRTHIEHRRTNERRIVGTSAAKAHRLAATNVLSRAALEDSLKFLRLKSYSARANCETIEIMLRVNILGAGGNYEAWKFFRKPPTENENYAKGCKRLRILDAPGEGCCGVAL